MSTSYHCRIKTGLQGKTPAFQAKTYLSVAYGCIVSVPAYWTVNEISTSRHSRTLDLVLNLGPSQEDNANLISEISEGGGLTLPTIYTDSSSPWCRFVIDVLERWMQRPEARDKAIAIKFILPVRSGFCVRSDFLERRLDGFEAVTLAQGFLQPRQEIHYLALPSKVEASSLPSMLLYSVGALLLKDFNDLGRTEAELNNRLSFSWISPSCPTLKRVAYVRGRWNIDHSERIWEAARSLGIILVIIDNEDHWLQDVKWAHLREGFIPANLDPDEGLVDRLVAAIRSYGKPIHGITTVSNKRMVAVAQACERLGLPTSPSESYAIAADKFRSREIEPKSDVTAFRVLSTDDLRRRLCSEEVSPIHYPVVVKPCIGWASECVSKVHTEEELLQAVEKASSRHRESSIRRGDVMIESYIGGPEIDANIVLLNGTVIFFEVADDFPSTADRAHSEWQDPFQETLMAFPSQLPRDEIEMIRNSLHETLLRQGFKHGIFNCEGRVRNSRMRYGTRDGIEDLLEDESRRQEEVTPSFYLHEINARPPGYYGNVSCNLTYGVDYYALDFLYAVGDMDRFRALAYPFERGPQWCLVITMMPERREGIMKTPDACRQFLEYNSDINDSVAGYMTWKKGGSKLQGPNASQLGFVGYFYVISRTTRSEALRIASGIRRDFNYEVM